MQRIATLILVFTSVFNYSFSQTSGINVASVKELVIKWNNAHTSSSVDDLNAIFADEVEFYGKTLLRSKCIAMKAKLLDDGSGFTQTLGNDLVLSRYKFGVVRCDFSKTVTHQGKTKIYPSYLLLKKVADDYRIIGESDLITDNNLNYKPQLGKQIALDAPESEGGLDDGEAAIENSQSSERNFGNVLWYSGAIVLMISTVFIYRRSSSVFRSLFSAMTKDRRRRAAVAKGFAFEQFIVQQFATYKAFFKLREWRGDKYHNGIYALSTKYPDLEYEYTYNDYSRKFAVECKYRSRFYNNTVTVLSESNLESYVEFQANMPVYIVLGLGGKPANPAELYLIPLSEVKLEMSSQELAKFRKGRKFFYDMNQDRLT